MQTASSNSPLPLANLRADENRADLAGLQLPPQEWRAIITIRPNLLIEGPDDGADKIIDAIATTVRCPVREWDRLTPEQEPGATLVVRHVDLLSADDHRLLFDVLNADIAPHHVRQVIATSALPLFALVESGRFPATLYYRLNTIRLELKDVA